MNMIIMLLLVDVAWDWVNQKLYWTDPCASDIEVFDPTTTYRGVLYSAADGIHNPAGMVIDPTTGYAIIFI